MDELASRAKADPVEFRLRHLSFPRLRDVVSAVAKAANWSAASVAANVCATDGRGDGARDRLRRL